MKKILFIGHRESSFCINDERLLAKEYTVIPLYIPAVGRRMLIRLPFTVLWRMLGCDMVYVWFGSIPAAIAVFIAKLLGKPSVVVAGGYDVANDPDMKYGLMSKKYLRIVPKFALNRCDRVIAVSEFIRKEALRIVHDEKKVRVVPNGIDTSQFRIKDNVERTAVTTVGNVNKQTWTVKGFNNFIEVAQRSPEQRFVLVGNIDPIINVEPLANLEMVGYRTGKDLINILNGSKYYLQLSYRESFGVAVIESMACGCIPVVTNKGALPEVVGDAGIIVEFGQWDKVIDLIAKDYDPAMGARARKRVVQLYDINVRERDILDLIQELLSE